LTVDVFGIAHSARLQNDFPDEILAAMFLHGTVFSCIWFDASARSASWAWLLSYTLAASAKRAGVTLLNVDSISFKSGPLNLQVFNKDSPVPRILNRCKLHRCSWLKLVGIFEKRRQFFCVPFSGNTL
jgi:hypothetical protein